MITLPIECEHANHIRHEENEKIMEKCMVCGMIFIYCDPCSWSSGGPIYHAEPVCINIGS